MNGQPLSARRKLFIKHYLIEKCATTAAKKAGYSAKTARSAGARLLTNVYIALAVKNGIRDQERALEKKASRKGITKARWLDEIAQVAFASIDDVAVVKENCVIFIPTADREITASRAIKKLKKGKHGFSLEMHSKLAALEALGRAYGWFQESGEADDDLDRSVTVNVVSADNVDDGT